MIRIDEFGEERQPEDSEFGDYGMNLFGDMPGITARSESDEDIGPMFRRMYSSFMNRMLENHPRIYSILTYWILPP